MIDFKFTTLPESELKTTFLHMMVDKLIHAGSSRHVYDMPEFDAVLKVDIGYDWQNMREWMTWSDAKGTPLQPWLAPCILISQSGKLLIQKKTKPIHGMELPKQVPPSSDACSEHPFRWRN